MGLKPQSNLIPLTMFQQYHPHNQEMEYSENQELEISNEELQKRKKKKSPVLPESLPLMMCEPKLFMQVLKETWVCSTDFIKWLPEQPHKHSHVSASPINISYKI
ncbi:hypothetical protein Pfo_019145 [Paulownia fortunei]|nr:hypothetical protein Pfo_019145 [Paulownia fortunei]